MRSWVSAAALAAIAVTAVGAETGKKAFGVLQVFAIVQPSAAFKFEFRNEAVVVTPGDLARGFVDLPAASMLSIDTLALRPDITVDFSPVADLFKSLEIRTEEQKLSAAGGRSAESLLTYRLYLADGARPGRYALPLTFNVTL